MKNIEEHRKENHYKPPSPIRFTGEDTQVLDQGTGKIRPKARLLRTIGAELISSELVAIIELVRNSYDADSSSVHIIFHNTGDPEKATLEILDDGHGMTKEILLGPWMEPATEHKTRKSKGAFAGQYSPKGRRRLGSKGVGRFATQRLGDHLTLTTSTLKGRTGTKAEFDWQLLEQGEKYLDQLSIPWQEFEKTEPSLHGTSLFISSLRDDWDFDRFEKLQIALSRLSGSRDDSDPFNIYLVLDGKEELIRPAIDDLEAMYLAEGTVTQDGICLMTYRDHTGTLEEWERSLVWPAKQSSTCGPFRFRLKAWDLDKDAVKPFLKKVGKPMGLRDFRRLIRDNSGVNLYRDSFRILPYGEPDNDWLRLDHRRVNNPTMRLSNNQLMGQVYLTAEANPRLQDQTNREGLVVNKAYEHLQSILLELIGYLESRRFTSRREQSLGPRLASATLPLLQQSIGGKVSTILGKLEHKQRSPKTIQKLRQAIVEQQEQTVDSIRQYAGLAATGQLTSLILSQLSTPVQQSQRDLTYLIDELQSLDFDEDIQEECVVVLKKLTQRMERLQTQLSKLDPLAAAGQSKNIQTVRLSSCIQDVMDTLFQQFTKEGIEYELLSEKDNIWETDPFIIQQVVSLIVDNAIYWLSKQRNNKCLKIKILSNGFSIANNGPHIPKAIRQSMYEPNFTTRDDTTGMGLSLARDLLNSIGAGIHCVSSKKEVRFVITLGETSSGI